MANKLWRDRHALIDPNHALECDARAAVHEIGEGLHPAAAEDRAYEQYIKTHLVHSASHHLSGMRTAMAAGNHDAAREHSIHYSLLMNALGHDPHGEPPEQIAALSRDHGVTPVYHFKNHGADAVALEYLRKKSGKKPAVLGKSEEITPLAGHLVDTGPGGETWELSHLLDRARRANGERLLVHESAGRRAIHHIRDQQGTRIPISSFVEGASGLEPIEGEPPADVSRAASLALRSRKTAVGASIASSARAIGL